MDMGGPGCLTVSCEIGNAMKTFALAEYGTTINLMTYSFYQKLDLSKSKTTRMTILMARHSVTYHRGIVEEFLVKIGKFVFPIDFMVIDMKEDEDSKLSLRVGKEAITFRVDEKIKNSKAQDEVFLIDGVNEENEIEELEKLMTEEVQTREKTKPKEEVKLTKPRASTQMVFEVFAFTTPKAQVKEEHKNEELSPSDEEEDQDSKNTKLDKMEVDKKEPDEDKKKSTIAKKSQGVKKKHDTCDKPIKKENSKKAYKRRVAAYNRKNLEMKENIKILLLTGTT
uniref:Uncharacterized protein n=1 Tax=Lactuca sativa TaxID=4236 RepID=A0A9R1WJ56_LACSA|nr:hypothetical protein LSAT_V11C100012890 [Lactuca sativa]